MVAANPALSIFDTFFRAGTQVFCGGHVVLPLLQAEMVPTGLVAADTFMAGYGAAQPVPCPLFTFAAFLGASLQQGPTGLNGATLALMAGVGASVVAVLCSAFYDPIWTGTIHSRQDFAAAALALIALMHWKLSPWLVILTGAAAGAVFW